MIHKRAYRVSDYVAVVGNVEGAERAARTHELQGTAITFEVGGKVAACGGYAKPWDGTAELWLALSPEFHRSASVLMAVKRQMYEWIQEDDLHRVQAVTPAEWRVGRRFLEWLGMRWEATLHKMGPHGIDQVLYARWD